MAVNARLEPYALVPQRELAELIAQAGGDGAVVSFVGLARSKASNGLPVETLVLEHHPVMTLKSLEEIAADAISRFGVSHVWVVHRCGSVLPAEPIVFAAAAAPHRRAAFEAADYLMDRLKTEAIFWKREEGSEGSRWVEPTADDRRDHERWRT